MSDYALALQHIKQLDRDSLLRLSGFIEGLLSSGHADLRAIAPLAGSAVPHLTGIATEAGQLEVVVAYASQTGTAEAVANQLSEALKSAHYSVKTTDVADLAVKKLAQMSHLVLIASTHGEGEPPDTAIQFHESLQSKKAPQLGNLKYCVVGLGDSSYEQFCGFAHWLDDRLHELGAKRLMTTLDCDVDYEPAIANWQLDLLAQFEQQQPSPQSSQLSTLPATARTVVTAPASYSMKNPYAAEVIHHINLCTDQAGKSVHHIEFEVPANKINYAPGDSLGIVVSNPTEMVDDLLQVIGLDDDSSVTFNHQSFSLRDCLLHEAELYRITRKQLKALVEVFPNKALQKVLAEESALSKFIFSQDWLSLLRSYPAGFCSSAQSLVDLLNPQGQRLYSISSSPSAHEDEIHLTVRLREFGDEGRLGLVSHAIANSEPGSRLRVYPKPNQKFSLPNDVDTPIIMIGSGTGIAPFRSFLYERLEQGIQSPAWLFFGEQSFRNSFLYQTDWLKLLDKGALSELTPAFSRESRNPCYVQQRLREHGKQLYQWIEQGAVVYVCGSAEGMGTEVHHALQDIITEQGGLDEEAAKQRLQQLLVDGFYRRDVY